MACSWCPKDTKRTVCFAFLCLNLKKWLIDNAFYNKYDFNKCVLNIDLDIFKFALFVVCF